jgi:hypothetical protein
MTSENGETLQDQLDVLHDLTRPVSYERFATTKQLAKLNIALKEIVGEEHRVAVLRQALGYGDAFTSSRQMYFSDAQGLIRWLWDEDDDRKAKPSKPAAVQTLQELKRQLVVEVVA